MFNRHSKDHKQANHDRMADPRTNNQQLSLSEKFKKDWMQYSQDFKCRAAYSVRRLVTGFMSDALMA
jgi:hypothetical protein